MRKSGAFKKVIAVGMAAAMAAAAVPSAFAGGSAEISVPDTTEIISGGLRFSQRDLALYDYDAPAQRTRAALPEAYDLRDLAGSSYVTSVKDQSPWGSCWAFGALSSAESNIIKTTGSGLPDLSERHLAWFAYQPVASGSQAGEGISIVKKDECDALDQGGNSLKATSILSAWEGAASEEDVPYQDNAGTLDKTGDWSVAEEKRLDSAAHLLNADFLPGTATLQDSQGGDTSGYDASGTLAMKKALMDDGVISIAYHADVSKPGETGNSKYLNYKNWAQYTYEYISSGADNTVPNHAVSIVGWDDSYDKSNFGSDESGQPPQNGAWIVKNSWGYTTAPDSEENKGWGITDPVTGGHTGYFYLSYYDKTICMATSFDMDTAQDGYKYDNNYQYDYLGVSSTANLSVPVPMSVANIFTANGYEELQAVSAVSESDMTTVTTKVYLLDPGASKPTEGQLAASNVSSFTYSGYHTVELDQPVKLSKGDRFSVVQTIASNAGDKYYLPIEAGLTEKQAGSDKSGHGVAEAVEYAAKVNAGESYLYDDDDGWEDMANAPLAALSSFQFGNVMIKAFTKNADVSAPALEKLQVSSYDKNGELIGETSEIAPSENGASIVLPSFTDHVVIIPVMSDGKNNAEIKIEGRIYAVNEDIPRSALKTGAKLVVTSLTEPEGYKGNFYVYKIDAIDDTVLSDGGVTLVDSEGYIPSGSTFAAVQVGSGDEYDAVSAALKDENRQDKFTLLRVATKNAGEELALENGEGVTLRFTLPDGYDAAKTQLYRVEFKDGKASLVAVTAEENEALALNTSFINSYYVLAEKSEEEAPKPTSPSGGNEQPGGSGSGSQNQNTNNGGKGTAQTGDTALPIVCAALILLMSGMAVLVIRKRHGSAQQ